MKTSLRTSAILLCFIPAVLYAQSREPQELTIEAIEADKKRIVALNMQLTEKEGIVFWPVYEAYQKDLRKIEDRAVQMLKAYAKDYESLSNEQAEKLLKNYFEIEAQWLQHKKSYTAKLSNVLPMKRVVRYLQIENKIEAMSNYGVASIVPLMK